jgi:hypothetical protein
MPAAIGWRAVSAAKLVAIRGETSAIRADQEGTRRAFSIERVDGMKWLASRLTWWHNAPQEHPAVNAADGRGK